MPNIPDISPQDIAAWFRAQAKKYAAMADSVEAEFCGRQGSGSNSNPFSKPPPPLGPVNPGLIQNAVSERGMRVSALADLFHLSEREMREIIAAPGSGLYIAPRGWVKVDESNGATH
ncbi:MAG: hypothetical protein ABSE62_09255 [Chthoniobacteraceae bacterium]|jgi:hypothetical protein